MINIIDPKQCCGCTACANACPQNAILMQPNALGFLYPQVNIDKCVECGVCEQVCAFNENYDKSHNLDAPICYAARLKDESALIESQSGGAFMAIVEYIISRGGVVYGVGYGNHFRVEHHKATTIEECKSLRGSKYVQSNLVGIFEQVEQDLRNGHLTLFVGTPCQTAGLNAYLDKQFRQNLLLIDIVCHGVPSPKIWDEYLAYLEHKFNDTIIDVKFRDKIKYGWRHGRPTYVFSKKTNISVDVIGSFYKPVLIRPCCSNCYFTNITRPSDITIGDFWSNVVIEGMNTDNKGCSILMINSIKGNQMIHNIQKSLLMQKVEVQDILQYNLQHPTPEDGHRADFEQAYGDHGFMYAMSKYHDLGWKRQLKLKLGRIKRTLLK